MQVTFKCLDQTTDEIPYHLLLLADPSVKLVMEYINRGHCFLAFLDEEIVGIVVLVHNDLDHYEIVNIAVKEKHQGKGIGKQLIQKALEEARRLGATTLEIGTGNSSIPQLKLYQKCGFRIIGVDHDFFIRNYDEEIYEDGIQCRDMIRLRMSLINEVE